MLVAVHDGSKGAGSRETWTYTPVAVLDAQHEPHAHPLEERALLVQRRQARAVLLEAVDQPPLVDDAQPRRHHNAYLLGDGRRQQPRILPRLLREPQQL